MLNADEFPAFYCCCLYSILLLLNIDYHERALEFSLFYYCDTATINIHSGSHFLYFAAPGRLIKTNALLCNRSTATLP